MKILSDNILASQHDVTSSLNSSAIWSGTLYNAAIQVVFTGAPAGTLKLQCSEDIGNPASSDELARVSNVTNWTDVKDSSQAIAGAGAHVWSFDVITHRWLRVVWTPSGGSGYITSIIIHGKGV